MVAGPDLVAGERTPFNSMRWPLTFSAETLPLRTAQTLGALRMIDSSDPFCAQPVNLAGDGCVACCARPALAKQRASERTVRVLRDANGRGSALRMVFSSIVWGLCADCLVSCKLLAMHGEALAEPLALEIAHFLESTQDANAGGSP